MLFSLIAVMLVWEDDRLRLHSAYTDEMSCGAALLSVSRDATCVVELDENLRPEVRPADLCQAPCVAPLGLQLVRME